METAEITLSDETIPEFLREFVIDIVRQELAKRPIVKPPKLPPVRIKGTEYPLNKLSKREREVLTLIANGYSRNEISATLGVTYNTACSHISNTYTKLSISTIAEATQIAMRSGLL